MQVNLSDNTTYTADLVVYRDFINSNGQWRLFWENPNQPGCGVDEQSTVTGQPFFRTKRDAVVHGERRYGITAKRATF